MTKKNKDGGLVYSTNRDFLNENFDSDNVEQNLPLSKQMLRISLDRKQRAGKEVTLITGFQMQEEKIEELSKKLKNKCGSGGSCKEGNILIQGDHRKKIEEVLKLEGFKVKII